MDKFFLNFEELYLNTKNQKIDFLTRKWRRLFLRGGGEICISLPRNNTELGIIQSIGIYRAMGSVTKKDMQTPPPLSSVHLYIKVGEYTESNENHSSDFGFFPN